MSGAKEAAESVFARIRRRRSISPIASAASPTPPVQGLEAWPEAPAGKSSGAATEPLTDALQIDELLFDPAGRMKRGSETSSPPGSRQAPGAESGLDSTFPRSATMRLLLKHPAMALGVGVPAAALLLSSPSARRILATVALRTGASPEMRQLLQASAAVLQLAPGSAAPEAKKSPARGQNQGGNFE